MSQTLRQFVLNNSERIVEILKNEIDIDLIGERETVHIQHNAGIDRDISISFIQSMIDYTKNQIIITGNDTLLRIGTLLGRLLNDDGEISLSYLKRTIERSGVILLNGSLYPIADLKIYDKDVIAIEGLIQDTITRIYIINQENIDYDFENNIFNLKLDPKYPIGIIKHLQ